MYWHYKKQIRNIFWAFIILTHPSVLQELDFIIYTWGGGSWYFRPRPRGGLANFTPIAGMGHLISESKFKIPTPPSPPANFWQVPKSYPVDRIYPLAPSRLFERWIALSTRYPADEFNHGKVGSINFYPPDKRHKYDRSTAASFTEQLVAKPSIPTSLKKENFSPVAR